MIMRKNENNLAFEPTSADDLNRQGRQSDVIIATIEKCERLEKQLKIAIEALDSLRGICFPEMAEEALEQIKELDK